WKQKLPARTPETGAWREYLEGRAALATSGVEHLREAIQHLEKAASIDPSFSSAWAWLSMARSAMVEADAVAPNDLMPGARDAGERASTLEPDLSEGHVAKGIVLLEYDRQWEPARQEFDRAVELSPGSPLPLYWRARWHEAMNHSQEALADLEKARGI